ncbi:hypothetical protein L249_7799 [Ophiocordyceps polyrhachis-furcata BCC 54312]|uniref:DUF7514 domain-containing protein n=1 Tax=Ophiocordyceps polyrhachis-furcata BCC 54312 TaxID=1330021 RepID=A0A367L0W9_9HYPO|nr:hypothetical protein L249_7799 [Ophiocordyceps polyrhachis-furcata BCC 54312]
MSSPIQYAYMFERNKGPTKQLDALLRAIAHFIIAELGDKTETHLTPAKLSAFYKAVGGDYDAVFNLPHSSISCIWQVTGCQHCLLPEHDDFKPPSIPALTLRGFSRWQSLEILLGPEEHVPYMQYAVRNWSLKHPETGDVFPPDLPSDVFPNETDAEVDDWHKSVAEKLRSDADSSAPRQQQAEPKFSYVRMNSSRPHSEFFSRPMSYSHVSARYGQQQQQQQRRPGPFAQQEDAAEERMRRRSFSDYPSAAPDGESSPYHDYPSSYLDPGVKRSTQPRRRSHPRRHSSGSSDSDFRGGHDAASPPPPPRGFRRVPPSAPVPPPPPTTMAQSPYRPHRSELRSEEHRRRNVPSPLGSLRNKLSETVSNILPNGLTTDRPRGGRNSTPHEGAMHVRRPLQPSRLSHGFSDMDSDGSSDSVPPEALRRRRRMQEERERDRRGRAEWGDDREGRRERPHAPRPGTQRRTSSHADADRHGGGWERKWGT